MDRDLTVGELQAMLSEFDSDTKIRFAHQPSWAMQLRISDQMAHRTSRDSDEKILYLLDAGQPSDAPYAPPQIFDGERPGMLEDPLCEVCGIRETEQGEDACTECLEANEEAKAS